MQRPPKPTPPTIELINEAGDGGSFWFGLGLFVICAIGVAVNVAGIVYSLR